MRSYEMIWPKSSPEPLAFALCEDGIVRYWILAPWKWPCAEVVKQWMEGCPYRDMTLHDSQFIVSVVVPQSLEAALHEVRLSR